MKREVIKIEKLMGESVVECYLDINKIVLMEKIKEIIPQCWISTEKREIGLTEKEY